ncbi:hypothetical protein DEIPH_ctg013orf0029 [Deinococcus phoenicis]|uniref:Uncharacterized protein n=1 Tax=Deinococcus phoenicis TaxID=1476583 RepID=A0A016QT04_9DEIO|nr:hypothetical protein [Deinococcus phoenicis]EYB68924.1 hypothetical protein DEIPH_ctg013orf0029 [Deinococcus phoenicis]
METQRLAVYPHTPTPPGTVVSLQGFPGTFTVLSSFTAYADGKKRTAYILADERGEACVALNTWHTPFSFLSERLAQLQAAGQELAELKEALRRAVGEER